MGRRKNYVRCRNSLRCPAKLSSYGLRKCLRIGKPHISQFAEQMRCIIDRFNKKNLQALCT